MEIKWKDQEKFKPCIIMLGIFHTIMMYLGIIGKRFGDGGLLVQSEVLTEGSVDRALSGKMYNRAARSVKIVYEAFSRLFLDDFHDQAKEKKDEQKDIIDNVMIMMKDFSSNINLTNLDTILNSETFSQYNIMWIEYLDGLKENGSELTQYRLSYLDMARILLNLLCAARAGLWHLFLETIRDVIPYCFAYDNINYSRYLTVMLADIIAVENDFSDVYQQFCNGHFHAFTGCDSVSAFAGKGKKRPFKLLMKSQDYIETSQMLGQSWNPDDDVIERLEKFTCHMYGSSLTTSVNELRYNTIEDLPPCHSTFLQHCNRANYKSHIWRSALEGWVVNQSPVGHGWKLDDNGLLEI